MDRVTQRLWRGVEGPRRGLIYPMLLEAFQPPGPARFFPGAENQEVTGILRIAADPVVGLLWSKSLGQHE